MSTRKRTSPMWEFFELREVAIDGKKLKKAVCKLCDGVSLAYGGGTSNLLNHHEAKHPVAYKKAVPGDSCTTRKQATLSAFIKTCPPARANTNTTLIAEFVARDLRPISTVVGKGFQQLLRYVEPGYTTSTTPSCNNCHTALATDH